MQRTILKEAVGVGNNPCRSVTAEEVEHYREFGWVKLKGFVRAEMVKAHTQERS